MKLNGSFSITWGIQERYKPTQNQKKEVFSYVGRRSVLEESICVCVQRKHYQISLSNNNYFSAFWVIWILKCVESFPVTSKRNYKTQKVRARRSCIASHKNNTLGQRLQVYFKKKNMDWEHIFLFIHFFYSKFYKCISKSNSNIGTSFS